MDITKVIEGKDIKRRSLGEPSEVLGCSENRSTVGVMTDRVYSDKVIYST